MHLSSMNLDNKWERACQRTNAAISTNAVYKLYVNEGQGIAPGSEVTLTLPLYSELSPGKYVTWWNGGRVLLADRNKRLRDSGDKAACSVITPQGAKHPQSDNWCLNANPNQARENDQAVVKNHLSYPKPVKWMP